MEKELLGKILDNHRLWLEDNILGERADLTHADLTHADLRYANLTNANLTNANLRYANLWNADLLCANLWNANLRHADLRYANLGHADLRYADLLCANLATTNLSETKGLIWSQTGPIGVGKRTLTAALINNEIKLFAGCFHGTPEEFQKKCLAGGWDWPEQDKERLAKECLKAMKQVVKSIKKQVKVNNES